MADEPKSAAAAPNAAPPNKGDHGTVETVLVKGESGNVRINKSDYNADEHDLAEGKGNGGGSRWSKMTKDKLKTALDKSDVEFSADASKDDLVALAEKHLK